MASKRGDNRTGRAVAVVGGGALLFWLLLRGKGWGLGGGAGGGGGGASTAGAGAIVEAPSVSVPREPCKVFIRARGIELDGVPADLAAVVARCRAGGRADVRATGGASVQAARDVVRALQAAGVTVAATGNIWNTIGDATARRS